MIAGSPLVLLMALMLDAAMGEPDWLWSRLPHPAVMMGRVIGWADARFNRGARRKRAGILVMAALVVAAGAVGWAVQGLIPTPIADILIMAILLAQKSLVQHVRAVADGLRENVAAGRRAVAMIVGRDTAEMDEAAVARAAIESAAENLSDGVIAPAFWYLLGGLPGLLIYKIANTADSMIGHRTERHEAFGWAAARLDDLINLPASRLTALLIVVAAMVVPGADAANARGAVWRDAKNHRSPNAGWPEAAMAGALGLSLAGPRHYGGVLVEDQEMNRGGRRALTPADIRAALRLYRLADGLLLLLLAGAAGLLA